MKHDKVVLAVTGGIAACKVSGLVGAFKKFEWHTAVMQTPSSKQFITEPTLRVLADEYYDEDWAAPCHIDASDDLDLFVVVPATANTIAKLAAGIGDNIVTDTALALPEKTDRVLVPAMNTRMWNNKIVQDNMSRLGEYGWRILTPDVGMMACGTEGIGKMPRTREIYEFASMRVRPVNEDVL